MKYSIILIFLLAIACRKSERPPLGKGTLYFPAEVYSGPGAVWKYYVHTTQDGGQRKTNIKYRKLVYDNAKLYLTDYAADFKESYNEVISLEGDVWKIDSTYSYDYRGSLDSLRTPMIYSIGKENVYLNWSDSNAVLKRSISNANWVNNISATHNEVKDSLVGGKKIKTFIGTLLSNASSDIDTIRTAFIWRREFIEGIGMAAQYFEGETVSTEWQVDEIMSIEEFEQRANHGMYRVAYIDPDKAIDGQRDFETCYHISKINDYYNDDRAQHLGGKGGLWEMIENYLNYSLLKNQEGYFTFRFVINCEGKAGRFVTEEADLEFNKTEFSEELRMHFLEMLMNVSQWKNLSINGEARDAYVYVTFKIQDDEIVEILP